LSQKLPQSEERRIEFPTAGNIVHAMRRDDGNHLKFTTTGQSKRVLRDVVNQVGIVASVWSVAVEPDTQGNSHPSGRLMSEKIA
jgi:hypothetical protein